MHASSLLAGYFIHSMRLRWDPSSWVASVASLTASAFESRNRLYKRLYLSGQRVKSPDPSVTEPFDQWVTRWPIVRSVPGGSDNEAAMKNNLTRNSRYIACNEKLMSSHMLFCLCAETCVFVYKLRLITVSSSEWRSRWFPAAVSSRKFRWVETYLRISNNKTTKTCIYDRDVTCRTELRTFEMFKHKISI